MIGAEIFNANGDLVTDFNRAMYVRETGQTALLKSSWTQEWGSNRMIVGDGVHSDALCPHGPQQFEFLHDVWPQTIGPVITQTVSGAVVRRPQNFFGREDLFFFRGPSDKAVTFAAAVEIVYPEFAPGGTMPVMSTNDNSPFEYRVLSPELPGYTPQETYGLQISDTSGQVAYDSRYPALRISHAFFIDETVIGSVLETGAPHVITLPRALPNAWICCPYWCSFWLGSNGNQSELWLARPGLSQANPTQMVITRQGRFGGNLLKRFYNDAWVILAEPV